MSTANRSAHNNELTAAYAHCRAIAKREARNFYFSFRALPKAKSDAMCAIYAFMRKADDLADDESFSITERRRAMAEWSSAWKSGTVADPIFTAVRDTQLRFGISDDLLAQLVAGTTMDLQDSLPGVAEIPIDDVPAAAALQLAPRASLQVYQTFDDLYRYCYLVASVVGLVTIRIFGYSDARAEQLAEHTGIAFQLTNILRDVREDLERGRVYLPLSDMASAQTAPDPLAAAVATGTPSTAVLALLQQEIERARNYYRAADALIPLLAADARPAMRVLVEIYRRLLERIAANPAAVLSTRVSVPTTTKLAILAGGLVQSFAARSLGQ